MGDDEKSSFHGSLSRFAYAPQSSLSSSLRTRHDQGAARLSAQAPCSIKKGDSAGSREGNRDSVRCSRKRQKASNATAHLSGIPDCVAEDLDGIKRRRNAVLFCGINPGHMSAVTGHHYANPTNHFWHCLHLSGTFHAETILPSEDFTLPARFNLGLINLVDRPSTSEAELSFQEMASSVPALLTKIARFRPGIWMHVERALIRLHKGDGNVAAPVKTPAALTVKRSAYFHLGGDSSVATCLDPSGSEIAITAEVEESAVPSPMLHSTARRRGGMSSSKKARRRHWPFKVVHDIVPHSSSIGDTHFCVFPSTSGASELFKVLRENLEQIKAALSISDLCELSVCG
ncbi:hypothetical protein EI94DRAFT_1727365 [Lactarius quietus]|nr:hypothetical protein EI94DRAFT_1727365 [Lactarius quietus]